MLTILVRAAYWARKAVLARLGWSTRGVRVIVRDPAGALLLVRHTYGDRDLWMLPGGGIGWRETPLAAAAREVAEETGCRVTRLAVVGRFVATGEGRRDLVHLFAGTTIDTPQADAVEIGEARFFPADALPEALSPATARRLAELDGTRVGDGSW